MPRSIAAGIRASGRPSPGADVLCRLVSATGRPRYLTGPAPLFRTHVDGDVAKRSSRRQTCVYLARNRRVHFGNRGRVSDVGLSCAEASR